MGIGWLWIYTHSDNPEALIKENESRAFVIYSGWRAIIRYGAYVYEKIEEYRCKHFLRCLLYTSPSPRDGLLSRMPSSA